MSIIINYGEDKRRAMLKSFGFEPDITGINAIYGTQHLEKAFNVKHNLVLKEITMGSGKKAHRWVDPNTGKEHAEIGAKVDFLHGGNKVSGHVGRVSSDKRYVIRDEKGNEYKKHPHEIQHADEKQVYNLNTKQDTTPAATPEGDEPDEPIEWNKHVKKRGTNELIGLIKDKNTPPEGLTAAKEMLVKRGVDVDKLMKEGGVTIEIHTHNGTTDKIESKATKTKEDIVDEDEEQSTEDIINRFDDFKDYVGGVVKGLKKSAIMYGKGGVGKAQPLYSKVLTIDGFKAMGEIIIGDVVITPNGNTAKVLKTFLQGLRPVYEFTFFDGSKVRADENHIWKVKTNHNGKQYLLTTKKIIEKGVKSQTKRGEGWQFSVPLIQKSYSFPKNENLIINPYLLGFLLGDGCLTHAVTFSVGKRDAIHILPKLLKLLPVDLKIKKCTTGCDYAITKKSGYGNSLNTLKEQLRQIGVFGFKSYEKHIPEEYFYASNEQKIQLIQGLMDSDGYVRKDGACNFSTTSEKLAKGFYDLVKSFGGFTKIKKTKPKYYTYHGVKKLGRGGYRVHFNLTGKEVPVTIPYKVERYKNTCQRLKGISITNIEYVGLEETKCILIDSKEHLYITDNYIVTHNTFSTKEKLLGSKKEGNLGLKLYDPEKHTVGTDDYDVAFIDGGKITPQGFWKTMWEHNGKVMVFDDCDSAISGKSGETIRGWLKGALGSLQSTVSNKNGQKMKDSNDQPIPDQFKFNGKMIFITNLPKDEILSDDMQPIVSRSFSMNMSMSKKETAKYIRHIATDKEGMYTNMKFDGIDDYSHEDMGDVLDYLDKHAAGAFDVNARTVETLLGMKILSKEKATRKGSDKKEEFKDFDRKAKEFLYMHEDKIKKGLQDDLIKSFTELATTRAYLQLGVVNDDELFKALESEEFYNLN